MNFARTRRSEPPEPAWHTRGREVLVFLTLAILVWPVLTVGAVGGYGFAVWMYQRIAGPPGPPRH